MHQNSAPQSPRSLSVDIAIVGGGLAGSLASIQLAKQGYNIAVIDLHDEPRDEFRAEQLVGPQISRLADIGVLDGMIAESRLYRTTANARLGKIVDVSDVDQYGVPYQAMVKAARGKIPSKVRVVVGRVVTVETSQETQRVGLASGDVVEARLVVLATGMSGALTKKLGIEHRMISAGHSLTLGFNMTLDRATPDQVPSLVYYGENARDRMDYLAVFAMQDVVRANLFCYHDHRSSWARAFFENPKERLLDVMPGLAKVVGPIEITSPVQFRLNDLRVAENPARDGVVLVGDVFQTPCPAAGTGIDRLLSDLDVLCRTHVPAWMATPGMGGDKIAAYYADPAKQAFDAECLRIARYRRAVSTRQSLWWTVHRKQVFLRRQMRALLARRRVAAPAA